MSSPVADALLNTALQLEARVNSLIGRVRELEGELRAVPSLDGFQAVADRLAALVGTVDIVIPPVRETIAAPEPEPLLPFAAVDPDKRPPME